MDNLQFNSEQFSKALETMGVGMLGIFIVTGIIIGVVCLLGKLSSKK